LTDIEKIPSQSWGFMRLSNPSNLQATTEVLTSSAGSWWVDVSMGLMTCVDASAYFMKAICVLGDFCYMESNKKDSNLHDLIIKVW